MTNAEYLATLSQYKAKKVFDNAWANIDKYSLSHSKNYKEFDKLSIAKLIEWLNQPHIEK